MSLHLYNFNVHLMVGTGYLDLDTHSAKNRYTIPRDLYTGKVNASLSKYHI